MAIHVTLDGLVQDMKPSAAEFVDSLERLKPTSVTVDCAGAGRVLLAALQTRGLPAVALEKRERPALLEVQRIAELSTTITDLQTQNAEQRKELQFLRDYQRDIRVLIQRLE